MKTMFVSVVAVRMILILSFKLMLALLRRYSISIFFGKIIKIAHRQLNIAKMLSLSVCSSMAGHGGLKHRVFNTNTNNDPISNSGLLILFLLL